MLETPVALFAFNRPNYTKQVLSEIRKVRPTKLFLIVDGPRCDNVSDQVRVREVHQALTDIDWPCEVHHNYSRVNLGCKRRVATGLDWLFEQVDEAIILEDDCVPSTAFFSYCASMLQRYRADRRVFSISGSCFSPHEGGTGHYFSRFALMWGWATWRDRWREYRVRPSDFRSVLLRTWGQRPVALAYWWKIFSDIERGKLDTWDYQWTLTVWRHRALVCRPSVNLVKNIGFGESATHTTDANNPLQHLAAMEPDDLSIPLGPVEVNESRDRIDEERWALVNIRSVILMYLPWIRALRRGRGTSASI